MTSRARQKLKIDSDAKLSFGKGVEIASIDKDRQSSHAVCSLGVGINR